MLVIYATKAKQQGAYIIEKMCTVQPKQNTVENRE